MVDRINLKLNISLFGKLLREYRSKEALNQDQLAFMFGVDKSTICRVEEGYFKDVKSEFFLKFLQFSGLSIDDLKSKGIIEDKVVL